MGRSLEVLHNFAMNLKLNIRNHTYRQTDGQFSATGYARLPVREGGVQQKFWMKVFCWIF